MDRLRADHFGIHDGQYYDCDDQYDLSSHGHTNLISMEL